MWLLKSIAAYKIYMPLNVRKGKKIFADTQ